MEMIRQWVITILSVIIFLTFVEILIPNSNNKRYINVVIGLFIMLAIIRPITGLLNNGVSINDGILLNTHQLQLNTLKNHHKNIEMVNNQKIIKLFKQQLKDQIEDRLKIELGYGIKTLELDIVQEGEDFGTIKNMSLVVFNLDETPYHHSTISEISVNVNIIGKNNNKKHDDSILISNEGDEIRRKISNLYQLPEDNIAVTVLKSNN